MLGNYLQQTTSVDDIFRFIFLGANSLYTYLQEEKGVENGEGGRLMQNPLSSLRKYNLVKSSQIIY